MRTYLVVIDETAEAALALRFASRRAAKTGGAVAILAPVAPNDFVAWGDVQATMEAEAQARAEALVVGAAGTILEETGLRPSITVRAGKAADVVRAMLQDFPDTAALVLGAAAGASPGPLVDHFTSSGCGSLPCPLMIIPGSLTTEDVDRLS